MNKETVISPSLNEFIKRIEQYKEDKVLKKFNEILCQIVSRAQNRVIIDWNTPEAIVDMDDHSQKLFNEILAVMGEYIKLNYSDIIP